jgi:hypothetical protein
VHVTDGALPLIKCLQRPLSKTIRELLFNVSADAKTSSMAAVPQPECGGSDEGIMLAILLGACESHYDGFSIACGSWCRKLRTRT